MDKIDQCVCEAFMLLNSACRAIGFRPSVEAEGVDLHGDGLRGYLTIDHCVSIAPRKVATVRGEQIGWAVDRFDEHEGSVSTLLQPSYTTDSIGLGELVHPTSPRHAVVLAIEEAVAQRLTQWTQLCMDDEYAKEVCDGK